MERKHYLKREKEGKVIQMLIAIIESDEFGGFTRTIKFEIDPRYKTKVNYFPYPIPQEELTEVTFDEFIELCNTHQCLTRPLMPEPAMALNSCSNSSP